MFLMNVFLKCFFRYLLIDDNPTIFSFVRVPLELTPNAQTVVVCLLISVSKCEYLSALCSIFLFMMCSMGHVGSNSFASFLFSSMITMSGFKLVALMEGGSDPPSDVSYPGRSMLTL